MNFSRLFIKSVWIAAFIIMNISVVSGQPTKILRVKNGQDATKIIPAADRFEFPAFQYGRLNYNNGKYAVTKLNYCYLLGEVMFINASGDTLAMAYNNQINYVDIGNSRFYPFPDNGFVEVIEDCGTMLLTKKILYQKDGIEKKGAYQNKSEIGAVYNASTFTDINGRTTIIPPNNIILLKPTVNYQVMDVNHRFSKANKTSFLKIFAANKNVVEKYLDEQNIDFNKEEDLKKAVLYFSEL